jgi:chemotaxis protein methyltransferase CheR
MTGRVGGPGHFPLPEIERVLEQACGISMSRGVRRTILDGLRYAARDLGMEPGPFADTVLSGDRRAITAFVERAVVGETYFFRHPEQLDALRTVLFEKAPRDQPLSIWSAGCATGEEPYSLAMALLLAGRGACADRILATDVSSRAVAIAREGCYGEWSMRRLEPALRERFFGPDGDRLSVASAVRMRVDFRLHNLVREPPPCEIFDVVVCRNVLIYFSPETARKVVSRLAGLVRPGGFLVLGPVELPLAEDMPVEPIESAGAVLLRARDPAQAARSAEDKVARHSRARRSVRLPVRAARTDLAEPRVEPDRAAREQDLPQQAEGPPPRPIGLDLAREAAERGDLAEAERIASETARRELCPESYLLVSMAAEARGDLAAAIDAIRRALYLDPDLAQAHAALVPLYARLGLHEESIRARRNALRALEGVDDGALLRGVESITAGALRSALGHREREGLRSAAGPGSIR